MMSDISFKLELFDAAYKEATSANRRGDLATARREFMRAAQLMDDIAQHSLPPLDEQRRERARKLRFIAENIQTSVGAETPAVSASEENPSFIHISKPNEKIGFDDIIGLVEAKAAIHRLLIDPLKSPEVYSRYGLKPGGFILLEGPPGTGKTTFAKAAASELTVPFAEVDSNSLVDSYIGKTGKNIDKMFGEARALAKKTGKPVVLFIDEIDYLAQKRGGENKTAAEAVPALIKQLDGFSTNFDDLVLIAATNVKNTLDPAILSRFRNIISIPLPTLPEREEIFRSKLGLLSDADKAEVDFGAAASQSEGFSGRDINQVSLDLKNELAARDAGLREMQKSAGDVLLSLIQRRKTSRV